MLGLCKICPILDIFGIALTHGKRHDRSTYHSAERLAAPVMRDQPGVFEPDHIRFERKSHNIRLEPFCHRARLGAGTLVGFFKSDRLPCLFLPLLLEDRDQLTLRLARCRVTRKD